MTGIITGNATDCIALSGPYLNYVPSEGVGGQRITWFIGQTVLIGWGPFTNDVSGEGEGGGWLISDDRRRRLRDLYTKNSDKGGRGSKISKI